MNVNDLLMTPSYSSQGREDELQRTEEPIQATDTKGGRGTSVKVKEYPQEPQLHAHGEEIHTEQSHPGRAHAADSI